MNTSCQVNVNHRLDPLGVCCLISLMHSGENHPIMHVDCMLAEKQSKDMLTGDGGGGTGGSLHSDSKESNQTSFLTLNKQIKAK